MSSPRQPEAGSVPREGPEQCQARQEDAEQSTGATAGPSPGCPESGHVRPYSLITHGNPQLSIR